jgi:DNA-binding response OmpR family regulator
VPVKTVLAVDDEAAIREGLAAAFRPHAGEFALVTAASGEEAVEQLAARRVDLLVTDLQMPGLDGFQLLSHVMRAQPALPVVVMSALPAGLAGPRVRKLGALSFLPKPLAFDTVVAELRARLDGAASGSLAGVTLYGLLQLLAHERKTCTLAVEAGGAEAAGVRGSLFLRAGELVQARVLFHQGEGPEGEDAALTILRWESPRVRILHAMAEPGRAIHARLDFILMEAARLSDELARTDRSTDAEPEGTGEASFADLSEPEADAEVEAPGPAPAAAAASAPLPPAAVEGALARLLQLEGAAAALLVETRGGARVGAAGSGGDLDALAAGCAGLVRAQAQALGGLAGPGGEEALEDVVVTRAAHHLLVRPLPGAAAGLLLCLLLRRDTGHLALARHRLAEVAAGLG